MAGCRWCITEKKFSINVILDSLHTSLKNQKKFYEVINLDFIQ